MNNYKVIQLIKWLLVFSMWLAPWASKMNQILHCDWLPERAGWSYLARSGLAVMFPKKNLPESHVINPCPVKMAGYWPCSFFASLWTSSPSLSINTQKKNLPNIQPSWPHTWSITHTYRSEFSPTCQAWLFGAKRKNIIFLWLFHCHDARSDIETRLAIKDVHANCYYASLLCM